MIVQFMFDLITLYTDLITLKGLLIAIHNQTIIQKSHIVNILSIICLLLHFLVQ